MFEEEVIKYWEKRGIKFDEDLPIYIMKGGDDYFPHYIRVFYPMKYLLILELMPHNTIMGHSTFFYYEGERFTLHEINHFIRKKIKGATIAMEQGEVEKVLQIFNNKGIYRIRIVFPLKEFVPTTLKELMGKVDEILSEVFEKIKEKGRIIFPFEEEYLKKIDFLLPKV